MALPGKEPETKYTREAGELADNFRRFCSDFLYSWSIMFTSRAFRTKLPRPDMSTGVP